MKYCFGNIRKLLRTVLKRSACTIMMAWYNSIRAKSGSEASGDKKPQNSASLPVTITAGGRTRKCPCATMLNVTSQKTETVDFSRKMDTTGLV